MTRFLVVCVGSAERNRSDGRVCGVGSILVRFGRDHLERHTPLNAGLTPQASHILFSFEIRGSLGEVAWAVPGWGLATAGGLATGVGRGVGGSIL